MRKNEYNKKYYKEHREKAKELSKEYYREHRENIIEHLKKYYLNNSERIKEHSKERYRKDPEKKREYTRKYCKEHREQYNEYCRKYYLAAKLKSNPSHASRSYALKGGGKDGDPATRAQEMREWMEKIDNFSEDKKKLYR